jgi:hypothetical protein
MLHSEDLQGRSKRWIANRLGQKVETYAAGIGTLVIIKDGGWAIRVRLVCIGCSRTHVVYLRPGCGGPDHYAHNFKGEYVADLRDQVFNCGKHAYNRGGYYDDITEFLNG